MGALQFLLTKAYMSFVHVYLKNKSNYEIMLGYFSNFSCNIPNENSGKVALEQDFKG